MADWQSKINELLEMREQVEKGGGIQKIKKRQASGKTTVRERIDALFDAGSFHEIDELMTLHPMYADEEEQIRVYGDGVVVGYGLIDQRLVFAFFQDFTVCGGTIGEAHANKICRALDKAMELKVPVISVFDSGGARIEEGIAGLSGIGRIMYRNTLASGVIPQISVVLGPSAGGACYSSAINDFILVSQKSSKMFITGPDVTKVVIGEQITAEELGGAKVHSEQSGVAHFVFPDDRECLEGARKLLSYLPQNNEERTAVLPGKEVDHCSKLTNIVPIDQRKSYDVCEVINSFVDAGSFFEIHKNFATNMVVGFARLNGETIGIVANQSARLAGVLEIHASVKAARFIRTCDCYNIPILTLVDVPAFLPGSEQERGGIIRHGAKLVYAFAEATVPKVCLILRKAYGGAYIAMNSKSIGADVVYAWPSAEIAVMGAEGAVSIIARKRLQNDEHPEQLKEKLIKEYEDRYLNPYISAEHGGVDQVILPSETKEKIVSAFNMLKGKNIGTGKRKHDNIPL